MSGPEHTKGEYEYAYAQNKLGEYLRQLRQLDLKRCQLFLCLSGVPDPDLLIPAGTLPPGSSISASGDPVSPGAWPAGDSISSSGDFIPAGTLPVGGIVPSSPDLFSIYRVYAEIRKKEAPKDFLKNWTDDTLTRAAKLLQAHSDDTVGQVIEFIEDFLRLR